ncbi:MAG TPA: 4-(cytidine 5'-diphospho)-2-C-methyl-D-erythritol kinase [Nitrospirae bacterium]|nr:4-(cytidine 5'-diphospho)-2-C-methyl-D-erythritol kinase [Nitrospirota bacterium]
MRLTLKSPAKINWFLLVTGKRSDGYHNIFSLMQKVSLYDTLVFETSEDKEIHLVSEMGIPEEDNLVYRAATFLKKERGCSMGARITLHKEIPLEAGLGGGSSNAATTLIGLNMLWELNLPVDTLISIGSRIGSDVAFFITEGPSLVEGMGERITPIGMGGGLPLYILIVKPPFGVSTAEAYRGLSSYSRVDRSLVELFLDAIKRKRYNLLSGVLRNDLEGPVLLRYPQLKEIKDRLSGTGAIGTLLSGSGSSLFAVYDERDEAERALRLFRESFWCRIVQPL